MARTRYRWLLGQTEVWIDGTGEAKPLAEMDRSYCKNIYRYLTDSQRAQDILQAVTASAFAVPGPSEGSTASDAYERDLERLQQAQRDPVQWMKGHPLLEALHTQAWGDPEPVDQAEGVWLVTVKVTAPSSVNAFDVEDEMQSALRRLPWETEVINVTE